MERVERLLKLMRALQTGRAYLADDLAEILQVTRRTIFRDLKLLKNAGIKYRFDRRTQQYCADKATSLPPITLTCTEALSLLLATRHLLTSSMMVDQQSSLAAALKIESLLPKSLQDYCGPLLDAVEVRNQPSSDCTAITETFSTIQKAIATQCKLHARYDSYYAGSVIDETLHPYRLSHIHRGWYLIAFTESANKPLTFKLERFVELNTTNETFKMDDKFTLGEYFGNAWLMIRGDRQHHVKIRFEPMVAGNVDEIVWHKTQETTFQPDGSMIFEADVDGIDEISWWILGYGDQAEALEPIELRELLTQRVSRMYETYCAQQQRRQGA